MSNCPFCNLEDAAGRIASERPTGFIRRAWRGVQWAFPTALLVLMPKCPLCVAMYVALFTGVGITVSTARWIQTSMLVICLSTLGFLVVRHCVRWWESRRIRV